MIWMTMIAILLILNITILMLRNVNALKILEGGSLYNIKWLREVDGKCINFILAKVIALLVSWCFEWAIYTMDYEII